MNASRTNKALSVVPPCFTVFSRKAAFERANTRLRVHGRSRHDLKNFGRATPRPCSPTPSAPLFHQPELSVPYLIGYSSLHRLWKMFNLNVLYTRFFRLSTPILLKKQNKSGQNGHSCLLIETFLQLSSCRSSCAGRSEQRPAGQRQPPGSQ